MTTNYPPPPTAQPLTQYPPTSGMAVASLVLGVVGITVGWLLLGFPAILAVIFGHVALNNDVARRGQSGRGMAIAGLALGYTVIAIVAIVLLAAAAGL